MLHKSKRESKGVAKVWLTIHHSQHFTTKIENLSVIGLSIISFYLKKQNPRKKDMSANLQSLRYNTKDGSKPTLSVLDQLLIPHEKKYVDVPDVEAAWSVIRKMQIRGEFVRSKFHWHPILYGILRVAKKIRNFTHRFSNRRSVDCDCGVPRLGGGSQHE